jgi:hypothetical protein
MYGLTAETSGRLLRECGHAGPSLPFLYLRTVDAETGNDPVYREADSSRYNHADYVTKRDWERMLVLVMASAGETLRTADGGDFVERAVDGERGTAELRAADFMRGGGGSGGVFEEAVWV